MKRQNTGQLVCQHLENISRKALENYQNIIRYYVRGRNGVYALYRRDKLSYVGLATDLRSRLKIHLKDRHANTWDRFSVYLTIGDQHLRELESLILRISSPKDNRQQGKFVKSENLERRFRKDITEFQKKEREYIFAVPEEKTKHNKRQDKDTTRKAVLAPYIKERMHIRFRHKNKSYIAHVRNDGTITFAAEGYNARKLHGKVYYSPSIAAAAITKHAMNGWKVWYFERAPGDWVLLDELRKK